MISAGVIGCTHDDLSQANIVAGPAAGPLSSAEVINGSFVLDDGHLDTIRSKLGLAVGSGVLARMHVDPAQTPPACLGEGETSAPDVKEACLDPEASGTVTPFERAGGDAQAVPAFMVAAAAGNLPMLDKVDDTALDLLTWFRAPGASKAYSLVFALDPSTDTHVDGLTGAGLWARVRVFFGEPNDPQGQPVEQNLANWTKTFECNCPSGPPVPQTEPLPGSACPDVCLGTCYEICLQTRKKCKEKGGPFCPDPYCDVIQIRVRLNYLDLDVGFVPSLPATDSGAWTSALFAGAKDYHLNDMFALPVQVVGIGSVSQYPNDPDAVDDDATSGIAVGGDSFGCQVNDTTLISEFSDALLNELRWGIVNAIKDQLDAAQLFDFDGPLPAPCNAGFCDPQQQTCLPDCSEQALTDLAAASFTYQKWQWFAGAFGPYEPGGGWLPITAVTQGPLIPPWHPADHVTFEFETDPDQDGIVTPEDNCWLDENPGQEDHDGDLLGDLCDPCPGDPLNDADHDGVCDHDKDNCPTTFNPHQGNCNAAAEQYHGGETLGDACDPVPCPTHAVVRKLQDYVCPESCTKADKLLGLCHPQCPESLPPGFDLTMVCGDPFEAYVDVWPLASHPLLPNGEPLQVPTDPTTEPWVETPARRCTRQPWPKDITCASESDISLARLADADCYDPHPENPTVCSKPEQPDHHYLRMTFAQGWMGNGTDPNGAPAVLVYDRLAGEVTFGPPMPPGGDVAEHPTWTWTFAADYHRWLDQTSPSLILDPGSAPAMVGATKLAAMTLVGTLTDIGTGLHNAAEPLELVASDAAELGPLGTCVLCKVIDLTGIPEPVDPPSQATSASGKGNGGKPSGGGGPSQTSSSLPAASLLEPPYVVWRPITSPPANAFRRHDATAREADFVLLDGDFELLAPSGSEQCGAEVVTGRVGPQARASLSDLSVRWARSAEPFSHQGAGSAFPLAVALDAATGSQLVHTLTTDGLSLLGDGDRQACTVGYQDCDACPSGRCDTSGLCCALPCSADSECPSRYCDPDTGTCAFRPRSGSPEAEDYLAVLSRLRRGVFVVGGHRPGSDELTGEIWFTPLQSAAWRPVPLGLQLGRALAATYAFASDELVVLDETAGGQVRLWAVDMQRYHTRLLSTWPRHPAWDRHWLVADRDGSVLLATARSAAGVLAGGTTDAPAGKTALCHYPPGNLAGAHTLFVSGGAEAAHLGHGDTPGRCMGHAIARFDLEEPHGRLLGLTASEAPLLLAPLVDGDGYTLLLVGREGTAPRLVRERRRELALKPASSAELGAFL